MKNFKKDAIESKNIAWTNGTGAAVTSGSVVLIKGRAYIAHGDIANNGTGALIGAGGFELTKLNTDTWSQGQRLGWDTTNKRLTTNLEGGAFFRATAAGVNGDVVATVEILEKMTDQMHVKRTATAPEDTANQMDITHGRGANPTSWIVQLRSTAGLERVCTVTFPDTNTIRVAEASLAVNETVHVLAVWE